MLTKLHFERSLLRQSVEAYYATMVRQTIATLSVRKPKDDTLNVSFLARERERESKDSMTCE